MFAFANELGLGAYETAVSTWVVALPDTDDRTFWTRDEALAHIKSTLSTWIDAQGAARLGLLHDALDIPRGANVTATRRVTAHLAVDSLT